MNYSRLKFFLFIVFIFYATSFYLRDSSPQDYCEKSNVTAPCQSDIMLYVSRLNSEETAFPYDYNYFDFCAADESESIIEDLIQVLFDEKIRLSPYDITFLEDVNCAPLCQKTYNLKNSNDVTKINLLKKGILNNYQHHWIVDNIPVSWCSQTDSTLQFCSAEFPMGCYVNHAGFPKDACVSYLRFRKPSTFYLFNHVDIIIEYQIEVQGTHDISFNDNSRGRILGIKVHPLSIMNQVENACAVDSLPMAIPDNLEADTLTINYTYSVTFVKDNSLKWSYRWDILSAPRGNALFISTLTSLVILLLMTSLVTALVRKKLVRNKQAEFVSALEEQKNIGWELLYGDVFRPPQYRMLLSVLLGSGVQVLFTALFALFFAYVGFLGPTKRGLITFAMVTYVCLGPSAGYVSARMYKAFGGVKGILNGVLISSLCSGCILVFIFVMNLILWENGSISTRSIIILMLLLLLWFASSCLLTFVGAYCGMKKGLIDHPFPTNEVQRQIPKQPIHNNLILSGISGGVLPFTFIFFQLFFILNSMWSSQVYYMFGSLNAVFVMFLVITSEVAILQCNSLLQSENYHWWWRSFLASGFTGVYVLLYCTFFFITKLNISDIASTFLYFGYALLMSILCFLLSGTVGFFASFSFMRKIYGALKLSRLASSTFPVSFNNGCSEMAPAFNICQPDLKSDEHIQNSNDLKMPWPIASYPTSSNITTSGGKSSEVLKSDEHIQNSNDLKMPWPVASYPTSSNITTSGGKSSEV